MADVPQADATPLTADVLAEGEHLLATMTPEPWTDYDCDTPSKVHPGIEAEGCTVVIHAYKNELSDDAGVRGVTSAEAFANARGIAWLRNHAPALIAAARTAGSWIPAVLAAEKCADEMEAERDRLAAERDEAVELLRELESKLRSIGIFPRAAAFLKRITPTATPKEKNDGSD